MKKFFYRFLTLFVIVTSCFLLSCDEDNPTESSQLYVITWSRAEHYYGSSSHYLTITELKGPKGASVTNIKAGKYVAKGTYDLTGSGYTTGEISLGFIGSIITGEDGKTAESQTYTITAGQLTGTFEVIQEIIRLESGPGNPCVSFVVGSTMHDRVTLY